MGCCESRGQPYNGGEAKPGLEGAKPLPTKPDPLSPEAQLQMQQLQMQQMGMSGMPMPMHGMPYGYNPQMAQYAQMQAWQNPGMPNPMMHQPPIVDPHPKPGPDTTKKAKKGGKKGTADKGKKGSGTAKKTKKTTSPKDSDHHDTVTGVTQTAPKVPEQSPPPSTAPEKKVTPTAVAPPATSAQEEKPADASKPPVPSKSGLFVELVKKQMKKEEEARAAAAAAGGADPEKEKQEKEEKERKDKEEKERKDKEEKEKREKEEKEKREKEEREKREKEERERKEREDKEKREREEKEKREREEKEKREKEERDDIERRRRIAALEEEERRHKLEKEEEERKARIAREDKERRDRFQREETERNLRIEKEERDHKEREARRQREEEEARKRRQQEEEEYARRRKDSDEARRKKKQQEEEERLKAKEEEERKAQEAQKKKADDDRKARIKQELEAKLKKDASSPKLVSSPAPKSTPAPDDDIDISTAGDADETPQDNIIDDEDTDEDVPAKDKDKPKPKQPEGAKPDQKDQKGGGHRSQKRAGAPSQELTFSGFLDDLGGAKDGKRRPSAGGKSGGITSKDGKKVVFSSVSDGSVGSGFVKALIIYDTLKNMVRARIYKLENVRIAQEKGEIEVKVKITPDDKKKQKKKFKRAVKKGGTVIFNEAADFIQVYSDDLDEKFLEISVKETNRGGLQGECKIPLYTVHTASNVNEEEMHEEHGKYAEEQAFYVVQPHRDLAEWSCSMQTGKTVKYPDGATQVEPGKYALKDGQMKFTWNVPKVGGDKKLKDDCILRYDQTVVLPSEAILRRDGKLRLPDGKIEDPVWPCPQAPLPYEVVQEDNASFWINDTSIIEPDDSDVACAFGIINLHVYRSGPDVLVRILEARGLPAKKPVFVMMDLSTDIEGSIKSKKPALSLSVKDITTKHLYKKSSLIPTTSPIKVSHSPAGSPNPHRHRDSFSQTQSSVPTASVSSLQSTLGGSSLGPFKTKSQKKDKHGVVKFDDHISMKLQPNLSGKYDFKDKCLTITMWEKRTKVGSPENVGVLFLDAELFPTSRDDAGDTWLAIQPPPPM